MKPFTCGLFLFCTQETRATSRSVQRFCILMSSASELPTPASASFGLFCSPPATALEEPTHRESIKDRNRIDQRRRREVVLSSQRARRAQVLAQSRGVWDGVPAPEAFDLSVEDHGESEAESESMEAVATPASATAAADEMDTGAGGSGGKRAGRSGHLTCHGNAKEWGKRQSSGERGAGVSKSGKGGESSRERKGAGANERSSRREWGEGGRPAKCAPTAAGA